MQSKDWTITTTSEAETQALGAALGRRLQPGDVIALAGDLGAGKTTFVQGLGRGLGIRAPITSPTFVLVNCYPTAGGCRLQHADCYRLQDAPLEMWDLGLDDLLAGDDIVVIEWADRIPGLLPADNLQAALEYVDETRRRLSFTAHGARWLALLDELKERAEARFQGEPEGRTENGGADGPHAARD